ncbi:MAG: hypothetical protein JO322_16045 [Candidatus Eremiobacteraeota bacterium]|nr:hypothetical protein [Candidatus Eremiobacteraeota bacterium]
MLALLLAVAVPTSVLARPRVIGDLNNGALLGQISDTATLQNDFTDQRALLAQASRQLGLTPADFAEVANDIAQGRARYVEIPRHLDGMAGQHGGRAFAVHNVVIPAHVYGWEVDLERPAHVVRVFVPNRCGNISYLVVRSHRVVAAAPDHVTAPIVPPVAVAPSPAPVLASEATPAPPVLAMTPVAPAPAPAAHHFAVLPWLALGLIGLTLAHGAPDITLPHHHCGCPHRP